MKGIFTVVKSLLLQMCVLKLPETVCTFIKVSLPCLPRSEILDLTICIVLILLHITKLFSQVVSQFSFPSKNSFSCALPNKRYDHTLILLTKSVWNSNIFLFYTFLKTMISKCQLHIGSLHFSVIHSLFTYFPFFKISWFVFLLINLQLTTRSWRNYPVVSSWTFTILAFTFRSMIHL